MTEVVKITIRRDYPAGQAAIAPHPNPFTPAPKLVAVGPGTGEGGGGGTGPAYVHIQSEASVLWIINHNLGYRPDFTLFTVGGVQFSAGIDHPSLNQSRVSTGVALAGEAHGR